MVRSVRKTRRVGPTRLRAKPTATPVGAPRRFIVAYSCDHASQRIPEQGLGGSASSRRVYAKIARCGWRYLQSQSPPRTQRRGGLRNAPQAPNDFGTDFVSSVRGYSDRMNRQQARGTHNAPLPRPGRRRTNSFVRVRGSFPPHSHGDSTGTQPAPKKPFIAQRCRRGSAVSSANPPLLLTRPPRSGRRSGAQRFRDSRCKHWCKQKETPPQVPNLSGLTTGDYCVRDAEVAGSNPVAPTI